MKKIFLLPILAMLMLADNASATELISCIPSPPGLWIRLEVIFHKPSKNCEKGFGFCFDITWGIDGSFQNTDRNTCPVRAQLNERYQLIVEVTEDALSKYEKGSTLPYFKGKRDITLTDPYTLSPESCKALGSTTPITIKPGIYPVLFENGTYTVVFQL